MSSCSVEACPHCTLPPVKRPRLADQPSPYSAQLGSTLSFATGSDTVKANVKSFIRDIDNDIQDCDNVIAHLENALVAARQAKADAQSFRDAHAALFPPIYSLPVELLTEIFLLTYKRPYDVFAAANHGPWLLGKVCRHWRRVAWASPSLWTSFSINTKPQDRNIKAHRRASRPLLVQALQRSPKSRVTFDVKLHKLLKSFMDPLIKAAPDWHEVALEGSTHDWKPLSVLKKLPSLTSLTVRVQLHYGRNDMPTDNDKPERVLSFFKHAPNLRRLWFSIATASGDDIAPLDVDFPWAQLTHLTVDVSTVITCQRLLACCPNLHTFVDLRSSPPMHASWVATQPTPQGITEHSNLRTLSTRSILLLQHTKCPSITQLSIPASRSSTELESFVERSSCAVRDLKISFGYLPFGTSSMFSLRTMISSLTAIRRLEIEAAGKDKVCVENLEALDLGTAPPLVPNMTSLVLTSVKRMKENIQTALLALCKSRMDPPPDSGVTPLAKLEIMIGTERHPIMHKDAIPREFSDDVNLMQRIMSHSGLYDNIDFGEDYDSENDYFDSEYSDDDDLTWTAMHGFADNPSMDRTPVMGSADFLSELEGLKRRGLDVNLSGWIWLRGNCVEVVRYV